ncbi:MAG: vanadium-dependent haloperoxidase [Pirellulaceae bacterium]|nr:vanadium-dependent haloperoxidase [Pirellulaceae bacterium]
MPRRIKIRPVACHRHPLDYSPLEDRVLLAGDVSVSFRSGNLRLVGDNADNAIRIEKVDEGLVRVVGQGTSLNGSINPFEVRGDIRELSVDLKGGNDQITLVGLNVSKKISVKGGQGNDRIELSNTTTRDLAVDSGSGDDTIVINEVRTSRSTGIRMPMGNDVVGINELTTGRDLSIRGQGTTTITTGILDVGRNVTATFGSGDNRFVICGDTQVGGAATLRFGRGNDFVGIVPERAGETVNVNARLSINAGKGDDLICLDAATTVNGKVRIDGGSGVDTLFDDLGIAASRSIQQMTDIQPNQEFRSVMATLNEREIDSADFGDVRLIVDPVDQFVTVNDRSPTISVRWNDVAVLAVVEGRTGPTVASRVFALVHTAMYDAWSAYDAPARSTQMADDLQRPASENTDGNKRIAMSYAAYRVLVDLFPSQMQRFNALMSELGLNPQNTSTDTTTPTGIGNVMASKLLEFRHADGSNQLGTDPNGAIGTRYSDISGYVPTNSSDAVVDIEKWTPERVPIDAIPGEELRNQRYLTPHWGSVTPFALSEGAEFRATPPESFLLVSGATVDLESKTITLEDGSVRAIDKSLIGSVINPAFVAQFEDVVTISAGLTDQQKLIAEFWEDGPGTAFPPGTWMTFGEFVSARDNHSLDQDARMFLALGNAVLDAGIATWETKRFYNYTRPVRAIRELGRLGLIGEFDPGLGGFVIDAWKPGEGTQRILATSFVTYQTPGGDPSPPFPDYTSGHSAFSAAAASVLREFTGSDEFGAFVALAPGESRFEPGQTPSNAVRLSWPTFTAAALEAGKSRVFGGIHFEDANRNGTVIGQNVGASVWVHAQGLFAGIS